MAWLAFLVALAAIVALGAMIVVGHFRFERRVAREIAALTAMPGSVRPFARAVELPSPVARYRDLAVGDRAPVRTLRMRHGGTFCMKPGAKPMAIEGDQLFTADPPGFVWTARVRMMPGVWIDARDMTLEGSGNMRVLLDDAIAIADAGGEKIDQGAALRLLAELAWLPTALFDDRYVTWCAVDETHARATLRIGPAEVDATFEFGADGLPVSMSAMRYADDGGLHAWGGVYRDWRTVSGMRVPFEAEVRWELEHGPFTYAHWKIRSMDFDVALAPTASSGDGDRATDRRALGSPAPAHAAAGSASGRSRS